MYRLKHAKAPRLSSKAARLRKRAEQAESPQEHVKILLSHPPETVHELAERDLYGRRKTLLFDLANLRDDGCIHFQRMWGWLFRRRESDANLLELRDQLREVWHSGLTLKLKQVRLMRWMAWRPDGAVGAVYSAWQPSLRLGLLIPDSGNIRTQLVFGVLENFRKFAFCANKDCPARYFLAKKKTQKFCERGECTAQAQREYALAWWNRKGKKLREIKRKRKSAKRGKPRSTNAKKSTGTSSCGRAS